ncbi:alpha-1,2-mannosidase, putative [Prevotella sp. khp1]|uniref:GH92 family glycosyl hydrolase n=1 Tax=Prevotellaceae TaxID=171552 RepID=UPI00088BA135|nr:MULTISPECIES: GH92 family glycosyl hydrolase [Prevotellaceae]QVJ79886.1 GH92 family glycosyl hydrolase [Xylanibacter ruminicola]SDQ42375.1 alpha-1,2-mannosidase, putative [Prevotella sp. khp1]
MKKSRFILGILSLLGLAACSTTTSTPLDETLIDYVKPNLGTVHSRWFFYTPAAEPFGMAKLGASTNGTYGNNQGWEAIGYEDGHTSIDGFPCLHEFQVGGISLMPVTDEVKTVPGKLEKPDEGFRSRFDKDSETAHPGYYSVLLKDYQVKTELTATTRVGFQRYTFPASRSSHILLNIGNRQGESGAVKDAYIHQIDGNTIEGYVVTEPEYVKKYQAGATVSMYFYAVLDKAPASVDVFYQGDSLKAGTEIKGPGAIMSLNYTTRQNDQVNVKIGLSYTSIANAKLNLETEAKNLTFDEALAATTQKWHKALNRIKVSGGTNDNKIKFYTGLYHVLLGRGIASDVNGAYPKNDGTVGVIPAGKDGKPLHNHYNTDAIWGAYWNLTPLWAMAYPEYYNEWVNSQLLVYKDAGWLGDGIANSKYVSGVGTNMVSIAIAGAYNSGIRDFDIATAYEAALKNELCSDNRIEGAGKMDVGQFVEKGYVPFDDSIFYGTHRGGSQFSVSHTVEYSFSAYAVAQLAKALGKEADYKQLMALSNGWAKLFDDDLKMIRPRVANGDFIDHFNPLESWRGFQEGNAFQYTFFVPQNPEALVARMGQEEFNHRLDSVFTEARKTIFGGGKVVNAFSGVASPYNHGNQPSLHIPWLFNFSGKPYLTQKWTRLICEEFYGTTGEHGYGYGQDEDQGQLGAWFVMAAMGLFDVQGGACEHPTYQLGSPLFDRIEIQLSDKYASGKTFVIETEGNGAGASYIQSAELNGKTWNKCWLFRDELFKGGVLKLKMGTQPNNNWGLEAPVHCPQ